MTDKIMGHLLRSDTAGCVFGCRVSEVDAPVFGGMIRVPIEAEVSYQIYGLIYDISIEDDGLVRQLVTAGRVTPEVVKDNRENRTVPLEVGVLFIGYQRQEQIYHLLPPRPSLEPGPDPFLQRPGDLCVYRRGALWLFPPYPAPNGYPRWGAAGRPFTAGQRCTC